MKHEVYNIVVIFPKNFTFSEVTNNVGFLFYLRMRDISADIGTGYELDWQCSTSERDKKYGYIYSPQCLVRFWGHPATYAKGTGSTFSLGEATRRESNHTSPSNAEVKNAVAIPPPTYVFMTWCLISSAQR
jgi:hypothetical protein